MEFLTRNRWSFSRAEAKALRRERLLDEQRGKPAEEDQVPPAGLNRPGVPRYMYGEDFAEGLDSVPAEEPADGLVGPEQVRTHRRRHGVQREHRLRPHENRPRAGPDQVPRASHQA